MCEDRQKDNTPKTPNDSSWQDDIEKLDYYYDDSTGYEVYIEEEEVEEDEREETFLLPKLPELSKLKK